MSGVRLGPYEIVGPLGSGGMGEVYRARDPRLGRDVAIKVLPVAFSAEPDRLHRFEQEARAAAALNHPNILAVHDIGRHNGSPYIVSELLDGETLRERLNGGALPARKAVEYAVQIAHGLAAAHEKGITHRDLKPENVFITTDDRVKILDFGLAKLTQAEPALGPLSALPTTPVFDAAQGRPDTLPGVVLGTIGYMSPEQVRGLAADHRSDIFAFGAVLYEMLSGQRAFRGDTVMDAMTAILKEAPPDLPAKERHIGPAVVRIIDRCLEKSPAARFKSADDLAFALEALSSHSDAALVVTSLPPAETHGQRAWKLATGALALLLLAVLVPATLYFGRAGLEPVVTRLDVVTPPMEVPTAFALSPDGRHLAFVATTEGVTRLWLRSFEQTAAQPLPGTDNASYPFWSPDNRAIGFFAGGKLKRTDLVGGTPQVLANAPNGRGGAWSRDGVILFAAVNTAGLVRIPAAGGEPMVVTRLAAGQGSHRWPQFLPDARRFLFLVALGQPETRGVYVGSLDGGEPSRVVEAESAAIYVPPDSLLVVRQSVLMALRFDPSRAVVTGDPVRVAQTVGTDFAAARSAFSVSATGVLAYRAGGAQRRLVWVDRAGKEIGTVGPPDDNALAYPSLAPDGRTVAVTRFAQQNGDVWLIDVTRGVPSRFTFDPGIDMNPLWSPDGRRLVFRSVRNGVYDLFEKAATGAGDEQPLLVTPESKVPQDWSPDGRFLVYVIQDPKTGADLWALPLAGERKPFVVLQTSFEEADAQFSPDGQWLAYESNQSGRFEIYVRSFPGTGGASLVSSAGGTQPRWRRDGKELYYVSADGHLMATPIKVSSDGQTLQAAAPVTLFAARLASGTGIIAAGGFQRPQYAVAPDGRFLMNVAVGEATAPPITIVQNWTAGLKQ